MFKITRITNLWQVGLLFTLNMLDFITTYISFGMGGGEANPLLLYVMAETGTVWGILWVKLLLPFATIPYFLIVVYKYEWAVKYARDGFITFMGYSLIIMNLLYAYIFINNLMVIYTLANWQV